MDNSRQKIESLEFAKNVYNNCKAYKRFLSSKGYTALRTLPRKFDGLPLTNKKNYIEQYDIEDRLIGDKDLPQHYMICTSSGSTGKPTIWPRDYASDERAIQFNREMYAKLFDIENKKTLIVVTFGLGAWTAGMLTARLGWEISKGLKLSVVTPGLDKEVAFRVIKELSNYYDQTIITGYPPFIIDLIEYGISKGFDYRKVNTKIHYTSARLLEEQRNELVKMVSKKRSRDDVLGFYASSEAGIIGIETPETVDILDFAQKNEEFSKTLFKSPNPPTFVEYNPKVRFLEEYEGRLVISVNQAVPLVRYDTNDRGGIIDGKNLISECKRYGYICPTHLLNKNFAYVYGRADAVRLLSNIYVEDVQHCLENSKINNKLTGNFKYGLKESGLRNVLKLIVFLKEGVTLNKKEEEDFSQDFQRNLPEINPDFKMVSRGIRFSFDIVFSYEPEKKYKGGKFNYFL